MKKLLAILICVVMCVGMLAMTASAATDYYVAGTPGLCGSNWSADDSANKMTQNSDGTYSITYKNVAIGNYEFKVTDGTWNNCWGDNGNNYSISLTKAADVTITFDPSTGNITATSAGFGTYVPEISFMAIRGEGAGLSWEDDNVKMTKVSDGVYEYTFDKLSNVTLTMKFTANGNWDDYNFGGSYSGSGVASKAVWQGTNISVGISTESKVVIRLDLSKLDYTSKEGATFTVTVTPLDGSTVVEAETITVYAKAPSDWSDVYAYVWDGNGTDNSWPGAEMTKGSNGWYSVEVPAWAKNIIITNGDGTQTQDIELDSSKDGAWIKVTVNDEGCTGTLTYSAPKTGDNTNFVALAAVMVLAAAGVTALVVTKKKMA